jgi:membrane associated rhomboid family serine protease
MLVYWVVLQFAGGITSIVAEQSGGVAFWAHFGGFFAGLVLVKMFAQSDRTAAHRARHWRPGQLA